MTMNDSDFLKLARLDRGTLALWIEEEWLIPSGPNAEFAFSEIDLARARLIQELIRDLGVNEAGVGVILNLLDQMHGLRSVLKELRQTVRHPGT